MSEAPKFIDQDLIERIETFRSEVGLSVTDFGIQAVNDRRLIPDLREGRELRRATRHRIEQFIAEQSRKTAKRRRGDA